jgi:hypothetical protein
MAHGEDTGMATTPIVLDLPFRGRWMARNSPARRVPSHGTHALGSTYAIDFIAVDAHGRSAPATWRSFLSIEPPEGFVGFGRPILAPIAGTVVVAHDGEEDHEARRSQFALLPYALGQAGRLREGMSAIAGNHVVLAPGPRGPFIALVHLRRSTVRVAVGDAVEAGDPLAECGNSGNSTQPHVHVQASDSLDWPAARGLPIAFRFRRPGRPDGVTIGLPEESEIIEDPGSGR